MLPTAQGAGETWYTQQHLAWLRAEAGTGIPLGPKGLISCGQCEGEDRG